MHEISENSLHENKEIDEMSFCKNVTLRFNTDCLNKSAVMYI